MNPEGFEPLARLLLIIVGLVVAAGVIGIIMAVAGLITGGIAIVSGGADITIKDNEGKIALEQFIEQYGLSKNYYYSHEEKKAAYGGRAHRTGRYCGQLVGTKNAEKKHSGKYFHFGLERKA